MKETQKTAVLGIVKISTSRDWPCRMGKSNFPLPSPPKAMTQGTRSRQHTWQELSRHCPHLLHFPQLRRFGIRKFEEGHQERREKSLTERAWPLQCLLPPAALFSWRVPKAHPTLPSCSWGLADPETQGLEIRSGASGSGGVHGSEWRFGCG